MYFVFSGTETSPRNEKNGLWEILLLLLLCGSLLGLGCLFPLLLLECVHVDLDDVGVLDHEPVEILGLDLFLSRTDKRCKYCCFLLSFCWPWMFFVTFPGSSLFPFLQAQYIKRFFLLDIQVC